MTCAHNNTVSTKYAVKANGRVATAGAVVRAFVCEDGAAEDMFDSVLTSTATALIDAVSQIDAFCETRGVQAAACAEGDTSIIAVARAQVRKYQS